MSHSLELLVWICLVLTVQPVRQGHPPPQNVSLLWVTGFQPQLSWAPSHPGANCGYHVMWGDNTSLSQRSTTLEVKKLLYYVMEGGCMNVSVASNCNGIQSDPALVSVNHPELVKNLECFIHAPRQTHCSWELARKAPDLKFFYRLLDNNFQPVTNNETIHIQECLKYHFTNGSRTGCDLEADIQHIIHLLFNGTVDNKRAMNTFSKLTAKNVRPPPLNWTVTKTWDKFYISWTPPEIKRIWKFIINYTECNTTKFHDVDEETSYVLDRIPHCPYRVAIKANTSGGETPYSDTKYFDANTDPNAWLYAAIIIPVMLVGLAVLLLVCCRKNKKYMFPKVPAPRDLLSDISDNNNKKGMDLYVPAEEANNCKITLVVDPLINKLDF